MFNGYKPKFNNNDINKSMLTLPMQTGVYEIVEDNKKFNLKRIIDSYHVPKKVYGKMNFYINYYTKAVIRNNFRIGILLTGLQGSGKSELAKMICNNCISHGLRVVTVNNVTYSKELIIFLESLDNTVFFFDEFSKVFRWDGQERLLTFLSNTFDRERVVILTENNINNISSFILNRPGRARYAKHFDKIDIETVVEYMDEYNVDNNFREDLLKLYKRVPDFTFDHLTAMVTEHKDVPDIEFDELLDILNLNSMVPDKVLQLVSVKYIGELVKYKEHEIELSKVTLTPSKLSAKFLAIEFNLMAIINFDNDNLQNKILNLNKKDIHELVSDTLILNKDNFELSFKIVDEGEWISVTNEDSDNRNNFNRQPFSIKKL